MFLRLELKGEAAAAKGTSKVFDRAGGTIGRQANNDWVLGDPYVSGRHAAITFANGAFYVENIGARNPMFLTSDGTQVKVEAGQPYELHSGDLLIIEPYEIQVSVTTVDPHAPPTGRAAAPPRGAKRRDVPPAAEDPFALRAGPPLHSSASDGQLLGVEESDGLGTVDPIVLLAISPDPPSVPRPPSADDLDRHPPAVDHVFVIAPPDTPASGPSPVLPPLGWNPITGDPPVVEFPVKPPMPAPVRPDPGRRSGAKPQPDPHAQAPRRNVAVTPPAADTPAARDALMMQFLEGAGVTGVKVSPELARELGQAFRVVVEGVRELLQTRREFKSEIGADVTVVGPTRNNPLKTEPNATEALYRLLLPRGEAYLPPVSAFGRAFADMRNHQAAMLAAMQSAFQEMLNEFDPDRLEKEFDQEAQRGAWLPKPRQHRYWEQFRHKMAAMTAERDRTFRKLFGDELANVYEEHVRRFDAVPSDKS